MRLVNRRVVVSSLTRGATFVAREHLGTAGLQRDHSAADAAIARNALVRRGLRDRLGEPEETAKMPRAVTMAITVGQGKRRRGDQRAETVVRRGARFNRIADLHCVVVSARERIRRDRVKQRDVHGFS